MKFKVGDIVLIRKGDPKLALDKAWVSGMDRYDGQTTTIRGGSDVWYELTIDTSGFSSGFAWHEDFLTLVGEVITKPTAKSDGCKCSKCGEFVPYVEKSSSFVCYTCKHR